MADFDAVIDRLHALLARAERLLPPAPPDEPDWQAPAYRWRVRNGHGYLEPVHQPHRVPTQNLLHIDDQKDQLVRNTAQFVRGLPANNALLWGSRGTGKSSLIKALLSDFEAEGLRLVEVEPAHLIDLPDIVAKLRDRPERFILFCDDLSFEAGDASYKALKAVLDGSVEAPPDNVVIYATSNRRHLMPEYHAENDQARPVDGEIHHGEAVEEKISLSERFGLWLSFQPFRQDDYLAVCERWLDALGADTSDWEALRADALRYALQRGSRSGRVAWQFARDVAGRQGLQ
jgi:predicted AAA+ superfamily ATPase